MHLHFPFAIWKKGNHKIKFAAVLLFVIEIVFITSKISCNMLRVGKLNECVEFHPLDNDINIISVEQTFQPVTAE